MKKTTLLFIIILHFSLFTFHSSAQSCLPDGIKFTTQAQIDSFQITYPNCTEIEGRVKVFGDDISNLNGLSVLTSIGGGLLIGDGFFRGNKLLTNLTGLENLSYIGGGFVNFGGLRIYNNEALTSLTGLENLKTIEGGLFIGGYGTSWGWGGNPSLINLTGLESLTSIDGQIMVGYNDALTTLIGLDNLVSIEDGLYIISNQALTSLKGLDNIYATSIIDLNISDNTSLSLCEVQSICDYLASPNGTFEIHDNAPGCNSTEEVEEFCWYSCLPEGITFTTQAEIDSFQINYPDCNVIQGNVTISGEDITDLSGLSVLTSIRGKLSIKNTSLTNLTGLDNLYLIGGNLGFGDIWFGEQNPFLTGLTGLEKLTTIGGNLDINGTSVTNYTGLDNLTSIGGNFGIGGWIITLSDLNGLGNLTTIGGNLGISLDTLTSLSGLDNLTSIGGDLKIIGNSSLTSLTGFENLKSINGDLKIGYDGTNPSLISLKGLENIDPNSIKDLWINNNASLSACAINSICEVLRNPNGRTIKIFNNAAGCEYPEEVEEDCDDVSVDEIIVSDDILIHPNPCSGATRLRYQINDKGYLISDLYSISGQKIKRLLNEEQLPGEYEIEVDLSEVPAGVYFIRFVAGNQVVMKKLIIK